MAYNTVAERRPLSAEEIALADVAATAAAEGITPDQARVLALRPTAKAAEHAGGWCVDDDDDILNWWDLTLEGAWSSAWRDLVAGVDPSAFIAPPAEEAT